MLQTALLQYVVVLDCLCCVMVPQGLHYAHCRMYKILFYAVLSSVSMQ